MTLRPFRPALRVAALAALTALAACIGPENHPSQFYLLSAVEPAAARSPQGPALAVGPIALPRYLDRPQIVTRPTPNELAIAEYDRWGGRLDENVAQVLAENLSRRLGTSRILLFPAEGASRADLRVTASLSRFECVSANGECVLEARWQVLRPAQAGSEPIIGASSLTARTDGQGYPAVAAAMSRLLGELAREIAAAVPPGGTS